MMIALLAQASLMVMRYDCRFISERAVYGTQMTIEASDGALFASMNTTDEPELTAERQQIKSLSGDDRSHHWPREMKMVSGDELLMEMHDTNSNFRGYNHAVLLTSSGALNAAGYIENNDQYIAVGMCKEMSREVR